MTQTSFFWEGIITGDATLAPYSTDRYHTNWQILFTGENNEGFIDNYLNELVVAGMSGGVSVASGAALVDGSFYENTIPVTVTIPLPITDPRIDRIVLRKDWGNQTIRITRIAGTENPAPTAPALEQTAGSLWDVPLAQVLITIAGDITVTDERENGKTPLSPPLGRVHIETITSDGSLTQFDFPDVPQTFRHLILECQWRHTKNVPPDKKDVALLRFNGDSAANYSAQVLFGANVAAGAGASITPTGAPIGGIATDQAVANFASSQTIYIPDYAKTDFYKNIVALANVIVNNLAADFDVEQRASIWLNTDAVTRVTLLNQDDPTGAFVSGSIVSLYGVL